MATIDELLPIFQEVFDDDSIELNRDMTADDIDAWDSLTHINLVAAVEGQFGVKFALGELQSLQNVGDLLDLVNKKSQG